MMRNAILKSAKDAEKAIQLLSSDEGVSFIEALAAKIIETYRQGGKLLIAGNGGSLCDGMHFAEELVGFYRKKRQALPAIALADPGQMSCIANDVGYETVFSRGVEAYGKKEDLFIVLTTSGNSGNLIRGVEAAKKLGIYTVGFLGKTGGKLKEMCDLEWIVSGFKYSDRVQEVHMSAIHIVIEMVEEQLFANSKLDLEPAFAN